MRTLLIAALLSLWAASAFGQGAFLARGAHGILIGGNVGSLDDQSTYTLEGGYSFKGTVDVGLAYNWIDTAADTLGWNLTGRSLEPQLTFHIVKQGMSFPFSISAVGSYAFKDLKPASESGMDAVIDGQEWSVGGVLHTVFAIADFAGLRPWTSIVYRNRTHDYAFSDDTEMKIESDDTEYLIGLELVVMPTARSVLFAGPRLSFTGGDRRVGITGGLVFN